MQFNRLINSLCLLKRYTAQKMLKEFPRVGTSEVFEGAKLT